MPTSAKQICCLKQCVQQALLLLLLPPPVTLLHFCAGNSIWDPAVTSSWQCICAEARLIKAFLFYTSWHGAQCTRGLPTTLQAILL